MMLTIRQSAFRKLVASLSLGALMVFAPVAGESASAGPFSAVRAVNEASALPLVDVQVRRPVRRAPQRNVRRRGNGGLAAGALIGAAILGGAIIANSQTRSRPAQQYYYTPEGYLVDAYGRPVQQRPQPVYQQQYYYEQQPVYQAPRPRYRQPVETYNPGYQPPRVRYNQPRYNPRPPAYYPPDPRGPSAPGQPYTGGPVHPTMGG